MTLRTTARSRSSFEEYFLPLTLFLALLMACGQFAAHSQFLPSSYDANGNLTGITREISANNEAFYYDAVNRLTATTGNFGGGGYRYRYDLVGNRTDTTSLAGVVNVFSYTGGTNRLNAVDGTTVTSDANGSITGFSPALAGGINTLVYNNAGRLSAVKTASATLGSYLYDAFGRRTVKSTGSTGAFFVYDPSGQLLEETDATGKAITDYAYVDGRVVGAWQVQKQQMVTVYTDRLGVPLIANDKYGLTAWKADYEPFGATSNVVTSNAYTGPVVQNTRLPGQYVDAESGFYQNGFRDYVPGWGRYLESDPIGLAGGMNTYAYTGGKPTRYTDRLGLFITGGIDVSSHQGQEVVNDASTWSNTPYAPMNTRYKGANAEKGKAADCSGSVYKIYDEYGLIYDYTPSGDFDRMAHTEGLTRPL